jgi:hypothetical protein
MDVTKELLRECFDRYDCDKGKQHDYAGMYSETFKELECVDRMLEIGFGAGRSGLAWRDALPNTNLTFLEKTPYEGILEEAKSLNMIVGDSARTSIVSTLFNEILPFDVIIDDGDHRPDYQFQTFLNFETKWTGVYVIEDIIGVENEQLLRKRITSRGYSAIRTYSSKLKDGRLRMNGKMATNVRFFAMVIFPKGTVLTS